MKNKPEKYWKVKGFFYKMQDKKLYYSRKRNKIIIEGKDKKGNTIYIWTLPDPIYLLAVVNFSKEKRAKINKKLRRVI